MTGQGRAQQSGIHKTVHFLITEGETPGTWRYSFSIGGRKFAGKIQAVLGLLAARRVKMKIDQVLRQDLSRNLHTNAAVEPAVPRNPITPPSMARSAASAAFRDSPESLPQQAECTSTVAFTCKVCNVVYEAVQVRAAAKGIFRCTICHERVHQWDGAFDYRSWRRLENDVETRPPPGY